MKTALKRLHGRLRDRWYLAQARRAIARCNRNVACRRRLPAASTMEVRPHFFAPGVIEAARAPRRGGRAYTVTLLLAVASAGVYLLRGGA